MAWVFRVLAVLILLSMPASAQAPKRVALVIGNSAYASASRLANPPNDARLVANALRSAGFQTVDARSDLGVQAFGRALRDFRAQAAGAQVALVYYAGHGIEGSGKNWLIPTDATLASEFDLTYEAISLDQVMDALNGANLRVVILDACRDNPLGRSWNRGSRAVSRGLAPIEADDVLVIYAAAPGQTAADGRGATNSPFAAALARRLPESGVPIQLLGGLVRDDVLRATGNVQRPFVSASITGQPFYLVPGAQPATTPASSAPAAPSAETLELAVWQGAFAANSKAAFEDYLRQYPSGRFRVQAQQNIARINTALAAPAARPPTSAPASTQASRPTVPASAPAYVFPTTWQGEYWGAGNPRTTFTATLSLANTVLRGSMVEINGGVTYRATLRGTVTSGGDVSFVKTYDGTNGWTHSVNYRGRLSNDGISGSWTVQSLSGQFAMGATR